MGIPTYERPDGLAVCLASIVEHLSDVVDDLFVSQDGSDDEHLPAYKQLEQDFPEVTFHHATENKGVATAKNVLLRSMMAAGDDVLFLCEDDIRILNEGAVTAYAEALRLGAEHLLFAFVNGVNAEPNGWYDELPLYAGCAGGYTVFTRNVIERVGYMDEFLVNQWEHIEYTYRIARAGLNPPFWRFPDVPDSKAYLVDQQIPGVCRRHNRVEGMAHIREKWPKFLM